MDWTEPLDRYRRLFRWKPETVAELFVRWERKFNQVGMTPLDLERAADKILELPKKEQPDPSGHLALILQYAGRTQNLESRELCSLCGDSGALVVPWGFDKETHRWNGRTMNCVGCRCWRGRKYIDYGVKHGRRPMGIDEYERLVPDWRELLKRKPDDTVPF